MASETRRLSEPSNLLSALGAFQRLSPKGKGWLPRKIGKILSDENKHYMRTKHGAKLVLSPSAFDVYASMWSRGRAWDYEDFRICLASIPEGGVFYEVGANVGYFAIEAAWLKRGATIHAFEPQSELARAITASARLNGLDGVHVHDVLVGDSVAERTLYLAAATIHASAVADSGRSPRESIPKQMVSLDSLSDLPQPDFVKMDVEGSEALVFAGGHRLLREAKPHIFLEYMSYYDPGERIRKAVEELAADVAEYKIMGIPNLPARETRKTLFFPIEREEEWTEVHGIYLWNMSRPLADPTLLSWNVE